MRKYLKKIVNTLFPNRIYIIRRGLAKGLYGKGGFDFIPDFKNQSREFEFLRSYSFKNKVIYDIGASIGLHTLFFAKSAQPNGKIFTFEPNPIAYESILKNISVNNFKNIKTFQLAVGHTDYCDELVFNKKNTARGSLNSKIQAGILSNSTVEKIKIDVVSLDNFIQREGLPNPEFVKIDVEGFELQVLQGMKNILKNNKPVLFIEIHGIGKESDILDIVELLKKNNYKIKLVETDEIISVDNSFRANHIICT